MQEENINSSEIQHENQEKKILQGGKISRRKWKRKKPTELKAIFK